MIYENNIPTLLWEHIGAHVNLCSMIERRLVNCGNGRDGPFAMSSIPMYGFGFAVPPRPHFGRCVAFWRNNTIGFGDQVQFVYQVAGERSSQRHLRWPDEALAGVEGLRLSVVISDN